MPQNVQRWALPACLTLGLFGSLGSAHAQAWVGYKGGLDVELDYNLGISDKVIGSGDTPPLDEFPDAGTTAHQITFGLEYVPIEKLAVNVALPIAFLKYTGNETAYPHPGGGTYDDGKTHTTLTDLRANVRYQVLAEPVALSPNIGFSIPVADYETVGNTVAGRHLKAAHLGISVGRVVSPEIPFYVHLHYEFSIVEKFDRVPETAQFGQNRSDIGLVLGYKLLEGKLDLNASALMRKTHGGVDFATLNFTAPEGMFHDAILKEEVFLVGGGAGYSITDSLSVSASAGFFVAGKNTQNANVFALGLAWSAL